MSAATAIQPLPNGTSAVLASEQVLSWLHDEESLVTSQRIQHHCLRDENDGEGEGNEDESSSLLLSRREASFLLRAIYEKDPCRYKATLCTRETFRSVPSMNHKKEAGRPACSAEEYKTTEFRLIQPDATDSATPGVVVALKWNKQGALSDPLETAHERDMGFLRDKLYDAAGGDRDVPWFYKNSSLSHIRRSGGQTGDASPATPHAKTWHKYESAHQNTNRAASATATKPKAVALKAKPTTAKSFFGNHKASAANKAKPTPKPTPAAAKAKPDNKAAPKPTSQKRSEASKPADEAPDEAKEGSSPSNEHGDTNATNPTVAIGNADDFVGDEDEDSEDEQDMKTRRAKSIEIVRKLKERDDMLDALAKEEDGDTEREKPTLVKGAMDAFCHATSGPSTDVSAAPAQANKKKRRKVFRETTKMNAQGFLVTTTEAVWEEIDEDDEAAAPASSAAGNHTKAAPAATTTKSKPRPKKAAPPKKKASDMKQGSLKGFFAVKKKK